MVESPAPVRLQNLYIARLVKNERPCFVCSKFTNVVLTSADNSNADWFYICKSHLGDFNFCSKVGESKSKSPTTAASTAKNESIHNRPPESDSVTELVSSIGSAWKSWRSKKPNEGDDDKKETGNKEKEGEEEKTTAPTSPATAAATTTDIAATAPSSPPQPVRFVIQRDYFYMRQREYLAKNQKKQATEVLKTLQFPEVPKNTPTLK